MMPCESWIDLSEDEKVRYCADRQANAIKEALADGMTVVYSDANTLLLDLDDDLSRARYKRVFPQVSRNFGLTEKERYPSKSGVGEHVILTLAEPLELKDRLLLQCCLGSDPVKEMMGLINLKAGNENPCVLFKPGPPPKIEDYIPF